MNNAPAIDRSGSILQRCFVLLTIILFALLPFHAFLVTWLGFGLLVPGPLNAWKEALIGTLFVLALLGFLVRSRKPTLDSLDVAILVFFGIGLLSAIMQFLTLGDASFVRIFYGFKYDFLMLAVFLLFRHGPFSSVGLASKVTKTILIAGTVIATFAILQATVLPRDFLVAFGYTPAFGTWDPNGPLATYQALDATHPLTVRAMGTFAGPNQFAMYCLIVAGLAGGLFVRARGSLGRLPWKYAIPIVLPVLSIVLSYSRSAFVGLVVAILAFFLMGTAAMAFFRKRWKVLAMTAITLFAVSILALPFLASSPYVWSVFVRSGSSQGHWTRSIEGMKGIMEKPVLGHGIGEAGPASTRIGSGEGWIPENWYLQIGLEYGLIGLAAWLAILFLTARKLYEATTLPASSFQPLALLFSFIAINVACLFLHAWEDSAVAITWWGLAGLALNRVEKR